MKICNKCEINLPNDNYYIRKGKLEHICKVCVRSSRNTHNRKIVKSMKIPLGTIEAMELWNYSFLGLGRTSPS